MRLVIQRVAEAEVSVDGEAVGSIGRGFLVLVGISETDTREICDRMIKKMLALRIFDDENGKTNLNLESVGGSLLLVSQFTLYADARKGNRPSFVHAGRPELALKLYNYVVEECRKTVPHVQQGVFGAVMQVSLVNDGPFTVILDSEQLFGC